MTGYDIIADIHGHASKLELLLTQMGYTRDRGVWGHSDRRAIFVGDFIDKGPEQVQVIDIVRPMVESRMARKLDLSETAGDNPWRRR